MNKQKAQEIVNFLSLHDSEEEIIPILATAKLIRDIKIKIAQNG